MRDEEPGGATQLHPLVASDYASTKHECGSENFANSLSKHQRQQRSMPLFLSPGVRRQDSRAAYTRIAAGPGQPSAAVNRGMESGEFLEPGSRGVFLTC